MTTQSFINWQPIAAMPDSPRDGRDMLLWDPAGAAVGLYELGEWWTSRDTKAWAPRFWADINPPE